VIGRSWPAGVTDCPLQTGDWETVGVREMSKLELPVATGSHPGDQKHSMRNCPLGQAAIWRIPIYTGQDEDAHRYPSGHHEMTTQPLATANELAGQRTDLAIRRTVMAADRSLMAWIRTGLSLISFGFTIYKLLQEAEKLTQVRETLRSQSPRNVGLFLTGLGTIAIVIGTIEYWQTRKDLLHEEHIHVWRPAFVIALIMSAAGLFMFVSIISRLL
jgi:putative membrane protein